MAEETKTTDLESIRLTQPCRVRWEDMEVVEGEHLRHCRYCDLPVYNFSKMSRSAALKVVEQQGGSLCAHIRRKPDGTIISLEEPA